MRSFRELSFRLRQEAANALLYLLSPNLRLQATTPLEVLPEPSAVGEALRDTEYAHELARLADEIVQGRIPLLGDVVDFGAAVAWRRDPQRGIETPAEVFSTIPYLDLAAAGDHKLIWEINRHQHLVLLAQACVITGRDEYLDAVVRQLEHWWAENQFQRGINWTSALEVGFRALSWIWIWHLRRREDVRCLPPALSGRTLSPRTASRIQLVDLLLAQYAPARRGCGAACPRDACSPPFRAPIAGASWDARSFAAT